MSARYTTKDASKLNQVEPDTRYKKDRNVVYPIRGSEYYEEKAALELLQEKCVRAKPPHINTKQEYRFSLDPNTKPRQTRSDKWKKRPCVMQYRAFADDLRQQASEQGYSLGDTLNVDFIVAMPPSWSEKKRAEMDGAPHRQTPDVDNFLKAVFDSLAKQDKTVWKVAASKRWGRSGAIVIRT